MNQAEKQSLTRSRLRSVAQATADRGMMLLGGYAAGRFMRNSKLGEWPMPLALGIGSALAMRRASTIAGKGGRSILAAGVGAGCYGAGKVGEEHGVKAKNDGNLFSWGKKPGSDKNEFYTD